jgi:hypothetical protein
MNSVAPETRSLEESGTARSEPFLVLRFGAPRSAALMKPLGRWPLARPAEARWRECERDRARWLSGARSDAFSTRRDVKGRSSSRIQ